MAGQSATSPSAPCKLPLILLLLLSVLPLMQCRPLPSKISIPAQEPVLGLRLDLVHRDSSLSPLFPGNITSTERLKQAVQRSQERLETLKMSVVQFGDKTKQIQSPVSVGIPGSGEFMMTMAIGTPSVSYTGILDTGSDLIWAQCRPCDYCYDQSAPFYYPYASSSYRTILCPSSQCQAIDPLIAICAHTLCNYYYLYGDYSSTSGVFSYETFTISSQSFRDIVFGCGQDNGGNFGQGGGIIGFGRGSISLISQLGSSGGNKFSYCLMSVTDSPSKISPLFIGETATLNATTVSSTPLIQSSSRSSLYYLSLEGISLGGQLLNIRAGAFDIQDDGSGGLVIDSGTTFTLLDEFGYNVLKEALISSINLPQADGSGIGLDLCYSQQSVSSATNFPTITFHFKGADYVLPKENYMYVDSSGIICLAMIPSEGMSIFGNFQQQNYQILYDNGKNMLSFAPTVCDAL